LGRLIRLSPSLGLVASVFSLSGVRRAAKEPLGQCVPRHDSAAARKLLDLLRSAPEQAIFREYGFDAPPK
jgi:ABC-type molybdate transport system substrate-binding protein